MKRSTIKSMLGLSFVILMTACGGHQVTAMETKPPADNPVTPQVVLVTATPTATSMQPTPATEITTETSEAVEYAAGTLLKGSGDGVFYVTEAGNRQHIYDWETFLAWNFEPTAIIETNDETVEALPLEGELTRLVDYQNQLYWVVEGELWPVDESLAMLIDQLKQTNPISHLDQSLWESRSVRENLHTGALLRQNDTVYYVDGLSLIPVPTHLEAGAKVVDVPAAILSPFSQISHLPHIVTELATVRAANVRSGPDTAFEIVGTVYQNDPITVTGQTEDGQWLQIAYQDESSWLATSLVTEGLSLQLLPPINTTGLVAPPTVQPTTMEIEPEPTAEPQAITCETVPLRGFGKVWGDHLAVQQGLGCPNTWRGGEQATKASVQNFQNGLMLWLENDRTYGSDPVYVFFNDGSYQRFGDLGPADPKKIGDIPEGFYEVGDKFSKVYWEGTGVKVKERLGYATSQPIDSAGAFQEFNRGRMFWAGEVDQIFVIYDYYYYDDHNNSVQVRTWEQYEDKF